MQAFYFVPMGTHPYSQLAYNKNSQIHGVSCMELKRMECDMRIVMNAITTRLFHCKIRRKSPFLL